ncbi:M48 family metalloprotease [candidate division KSB1 bacterium]|nr:M48 family metalloprotease [candidate division KSB1 bacterium]
MKSRYFYLSTFLMLIIFIISCSTVPVTGRRQLDLIPTSTMLSMSYQQYDEFLKNHELSDNQRQTAMVKRVGTNIQKAVEEYMAENNMSDQLENYKWEFNLIESEEVNAWAMPGGKVVIYTGILEVAQDAGGLAVVMGHEVAHAVARHGDERMSQGLVTQLGGMALSAALENKPEQTRQLWLAAFGVGAQVGFLLPYSRLHEGEADQLGLIFMAMADYDPRQAVDFWQRMAAQGGGQPPEFLSTHPASESRIENIKSHMPEALKYYRQ